MVTRGAFAIATGAPSEAGAAEKVQKGLVSTMSKIESFSKAFASGLPAVAAVAFAGLLLAPEAQAQVNPNNSKNSQTVTVTPTGTNNTPVVNIVAPNTGGLSHNYYTDFNVDSHNLVLNNSNTGGTSVLAGSVSANPNLGSSTATVILNEVTGGNLSLLLGKIETFGGTADFILANPNGVTCNGCGFVTTPRVTLTTGDVSTFDTTGQIKVTGGSVNFGAGNADLSGVTYFDVIAGSIGTSASGGTISGNSNIRMLSGANTYTYNSDPTKDLSYTSSGSAGNGIDLSLLGGANAGQITLISTDQGAGVKAPSNMTTTGGIKLTANGQIVFGNATAGGSISANSNGTPASNGIVVGSGNQVSAQGGSVNFVTTTSGDIQLLGGVAATTTLTLQAAGAVTVNSGVTASSGTGSTITAGTSVTNNGTVSSSGTSTNGSSIVAGTSFLNNGTVSFINDTISITTQTGDLTNYTGGLIEAQTLKLAAAHTLFNKVNSKLTARADITLTANTLNTDGGIANDGSIAAGTTTAGSKLQVTQAAYLTNTGSFNAANGAVSATVSGDFNNTGTIGIDPSTNATSAASTDLTAGSFSNSNKVASNGTTSVTTTLGDLTNSGSISGQSLNANAAGKLDNQATGKLNSSADMTLSANTLTNEGSVNAGTTLLVTNTGALNNSGSINAGTNLTVNKTGDLTNTGTITAQADATINVTGTLTNGALPTPVNATIHAGGTLNIDAAVLKNLGGMDITLPRGELSGLYLIINAGNVQNSGNLFATKDMTIDSTGDIVNEMGWIKVGGYLSITAGGNFDNIVGMIQASSASINAQTMENVVLVRLDDDQLLPKRNHNVLRAITSQSVAQAVAGWDKSVLAKFGTVDNKALDTLRLQLGDPFLIQQKQQQQGKGAGNFPQPGQGASAKRADAAAGARPTAF